MWPTLFLVGAWLTITPPPNLVTDSTSVIVAEFSREVSEQGGLLDVDNYFIQENEGTRIYEIHRIEIIDSLDGDSVTVGTTLIALITEKFEYNKIYKITVNNIVDKTGQHIDVNRNVCYYFYNAFVPHLIDSPIVNIESK